MEICINPDENNDINVNPSNNIENGSEFIIKEGETPDEILEVVVKTEDEEFDAYTDKNQIYKKYKLRNGARKPDDRIPRITDIPKSKSSGRISTHEVRCMQCYKNFRSRSDLRDHVQSSHKITYTCSLCSEKFETNAELVAHKSVHEDGTQSFMCYRCQLAFSDHFDYLKHQIQHEQRETYKCMECGLSYGRSGIERHIVTHFKRLQKCAICSLEVNGEYNYKSHLRKHDENAKKYVCVECGKVEFEKYALESHLAIHTGVKPFQCLYCGKGFRLASQRKVHTRIHTDHRPFQCKSCDKAFKQQTDLERHIEAFHGKMKKHKCGICKKEYKMKYLLVAHMKVHKGMDMYGCPECSKKFASMGGLKSHVLFIHTTERLVECKLCDKSFTGKNQLQRHERSKYHKRNLYGAMNGDDRDDDDVIQATNKH